MQQPPFLPMSQAELKSLGWQELDILLISGDAYVDHPSFGAALIGRYLTSLGYRTGIIAQPDWKDPASVTRLGRPRLFAGVTAGAMDSLVANYTANKKMRRTDAYSPGNRYGLRPNRATIIYTNLLRHVFPGLPIVLGGIEASLRRLAHYDYWDDQLRRSLLLDSKADILVYGMGEHPVREIAQRLQHGKSLEGIRGTAVVIQPPPDNPSVQMLPSFEKLLADKQLVMQAVLAEERFRNHPEGKILCQQQGQRWVVVYPPAEPLSTLELDALYALPFSRGPHPQYREPIPALEPVLNSVVTHRGCFGGCAFCALGAHQGKTIQSRSQAGLLAEIKQLSLLKTFHGTITDLGGPSANMYGMKCTRPAGTCQRPSCLFPQICAHLSTSHAAQLGLLKKLKTLPKVKHVFVASGIRYDLALKDAAYLPGLVAGRHVSGALKVAPEQVDEELLKYMRKPGIEIFEKFITVYREACRQHQQPGYLTAYFISAFPGSDQTSMQRVREFSRKHHLRIEQMQDFIPLPMTLAGAMYYTGLDPFGLTPLRWKKNFAERKAQRAILLNPAFPFRQRKNLRRSGNQSGYGFGKNGAGGK